MISKKRLSRGCRVVSKHSKAVFTIITIVDYGSTGPIYEVVEDGCPYTTILAGHDIAEVIRDGEVCSVSVSGGKPSVRF